MTATQISQAVEFELLGRLPTGTTVLEASAGTGKTYTIAGLVARYVAEGVARVDELLVVTFGRAATQELRERVRERLVSARDGLADPIVARVSTDELLAHLATGDDAELRLRRQRLTDALASFDAATVATTHQFCQQVLIGLGTAGDVDAGAVLVDSLNDLIEEVVDDLYLRMWARDGAGTPSLTRDEALELARTVVGDTDAQLVPTDPPPDELPGIRLRFAQAVKKEVELRKRKRRLLGFDDLLTRLRDTLADPDVGPAAKARLRGRYQVVLVDEFQDTDAVQWEILHLAFHGAVTLVLIGDPKQAIYAFRGADVYAYLAAAGVAGERATLASNWRSDPDVLRGLSALFRGAALGDPQIAVQPVTEAHSGRSLDVAGAPVRLRVVEQGKARLSTDDARAIVARDLVADVIALLDSKATFTPRWKSESRPIAPGDIAVIVRTGKQLEVVHAALLAAGVPAVQRTTSSVFKTAAAADWIVLLEALEQPHRIGRVRRLALSSFIGWDAAELEKQDSDDLSLRLRGWLQMLDERGIAALFQAISGSEQLSARVLAQLDGERRLTDLRHVGEALHEAAMQGQLGLTAVLKWLRRRVEESADDETRERSRRLDTDTAAVQVATIHASKGLEFPIVYVPFAWDRFVFEPKIPLFHDDDGVRVRDVSGRQGPGFAQNVARHKHEDFGEDLRLLYVALTRAQAQVTAWWAPTRNTECSPLHRLLFTDDPSAPMPNRITVPNDAVAYPRIAGRAVEGCLSVTKVVATPAVTWSPTRAANPALAAAVFGRGVDTGWRRTSYSSLTAAAHDAGPRIGSEPEIDQKDDEPVLAPDVVAVADDAHLRQVTSPMDALVGSAAFGTLVHSIFEELDPTAADLEAELLEHVVAQVGWHGAVGIDPAELTAALLPSLRTPLGPIADRLRLRDISPRDRLPELDFELPLCGGDDPVGLAVLGDLAPLLRKHLAADDPMAAYADLLADPLLAATPLRGYLGGSIDAVLRVGGRYLVVDYKTNRLAAHDETLTAWHYRMPAMADAMLHAHYPLQALLYDVALHRYLRWRVADYDPEQHLGGVLYLFLRGMCGPDIVAVDGSVPGVFAWQPPAALVVALSDALAKGVR